MPFEPLVLKVHIDTKFASRCNLSNIVHNSYVEYSKNILISLHMANINIFELRFSCGWHWCCWRRW